MDRTYIWVCIILLLICVALVLFYNSGSLLREYKNEAKRALEKIYGADNTILTLEDIQDLPKPVQNYIKYVGAIGKEKVHSFSVLAKGEMKMSNNSDWTPLDIEQYNFLDTQLIRLCYMKLKVYGLPIYALHSYTDKKANMHIKLAGLITVADAKGQEMRISDSITLLNDICLFAPAALIDDRISWEEIDDTTVKAIFNTAYCTVSATLYFNERGELINFISEDRYELKNDGSFRKAKWSTPFRDYKELDGMKVASYCEAIWNFPEGDYGYCRFTDIKKINYNCSNQDYRQ
ncbi:DUF6544 family protein [Acetanaerobacterium elongatum]|uniref:Uncharacterized protein n=1 Tax=Acetanaerobacterium elongatum TaxID=258515 RepID=A0A1G9UK32_9FIRM|nr:DUF6544 family protein [Acetanaerobacterium elongatum]SDM60290.1 hypothetical protein SAMN05192585_10240 [Acetanaerobacterium elongatum]